MSATKHPVQEDLHALYRDHHDWLLGWLRRRLGGMADAADMAHDTFVRIIASRDLLVGLREPRAFLTTTAQRLLIDRSRRQLIERAYLDALAQLADVMPSYPSPESILMAVQALAQIDRALEGAPPRVREAFLRHYLDEQTHAAIAVAMDVSKRMVQKYLVQALLHCRAQCATLAEHGL